MPNGRVFTNRNITNERQQFSFTTQIRFCFDYSNNAKATATRSTTKITASVSMISVFCFCCLENLSYCVSLRLLLNIFDYVILLLLPISPHDHHDHHDESQKTTIITNSSTILEYCIKYRCMYDLVYQVFYQMYYL